MAQLRSSRRRALARTALLAASCVAFVAAPAHASGNGPWSVTGFITDATGAHPIYDHAAVLAADGYAYEIGGLTRDADGIEMANSWIGSSPLGAGDWTQAGSALPGVNFFDQAAVSVNGYIYLLGVGAPPHIIYYQRPLGGGQLSHYCCNYADGWHITVDLPHPMRYQSAAVLGDSIFLLDGSDLYRGNVEPDGQIDYWDAVSTVPEGVNAATLTAAGDHLIVVGGEAMDGVTITGPNAAVYMTRVSDSGAVGPWTRGPDLPTPTYAHAAVAIGDDIYVMGGLHGPGYGATADVVYASVQSDGSLSDWITSPNPLPESRYAAAAVAQGHTIHLVGGLTGGLTSHDPGLSSAVSSVVDSRPTDADLLSEYAPELRYDLFEEYRADDPAEMPASYVSGSHTNRLQTQNKKGADVTLADSDPAVAGTDRLPVLTSGYLGAFYPDGSGARPGDKIDESDTYAEDEQRLHADPRYADAYVGRVATNGDGSKVLQYWFFYYYNSKTYLTRGAHEGDWEMAQVHLDTSLNPVAATYAQHDWGERCEWAHVQRNAAGHPVVYVAEGSHASYFSSGYHLNLGPNGEGPADDTASGDGDGGLLTPRILDADSSQTLRLLSWPGHWGGTPDTTLGAESPVGPEFQGAKWSTPEAWSTSSSVKSCTEEQTQGGTSATLSRSPGSAGSSADMASPRVRAHVAGHRVRFRYSFANALGRNVARPKALLLAVRGRGRHATPTVRLLTELKGRGGAYLPRPLERGRLRLFYAPESGRGRRGAVRSVRVRQ